LSLAGSQNVDLLSDSEIIGKITSDISLTLAEKALSIKSADAYSESNDSQNAKRPKHLTAGVEHLRTHEYFSSLPVHEFMRKVLLEGLVKYYKKNKQFPWSYLGCIEEQ
jgi:hypothetical protein